MSKWRRVASHQSDGQVFRQRELRALLATAAKVDRRKLALAHFELVEHQADVGQDVFVLLRIQLGDLATAAATDDIRQGLYVRLPVRAVPPRRVLLGVEPVCVLGQTAAAPKELAAPTHHFGEAMPIRRLRRADPGIGIPGGGSEPRRILSAVCWAMCRSIRAMTSLVSIT